MKPFIFGLDIWEGQPGGTVVERFERDGEKYVYVVFDKSPNMRYLYLDGEDG